MTKPKVTHKLLRFYDDGKIEIVKRGLSAKRAIDAYNDEHRAMDGNIKRIVVTDDKTDVMLEWKRGEGGTWPDNCKKCGRQSRTFPPYYCCVCNY